MSKLAWDIAGDDNGTDELYHVLEVGDPVPSRCSPCEFNLAVRIHGQKEYIPLAEDEDHTLRWENSRTHKIVGYSNPTTDVSFSV